jgi:adenine-specific DNA-methyltransferase
MVLEFDKFFVTRYMGAKYKLLDFILPPITNLLQEGETFVDLMAGTHSVGYALKKRNRIIANDIQYYSKIFGEAIIENNTLNSVNFRFSSDFDKLEIDQKLSNWFVDTYSDTYFSKYQCQEISAIRILISKLNDPYVQQIYLTALAYAMSLCQSSTGHFAQYLPKSHPRLKYLRSLSILETFRQRCVDIEIVISNYGGKVFNLEISDFLSKDYLDEYAGSGSLAYLDPPYSPAQYSRYYHLLETVFLNDEPIVGFKGVYREDRFQSDFCSTKKALKAFENVISNVANKDWHLVISYANSGVVDIADLKEVCKNFYPVVNVLNRDYSHSTQGRGETRDISELLVVCSKN